MAVLSTMDYRLKNVSMSQRELEFLIEILFNYVNRLMIDLDVSTRFDTLVLDALNEYFVIKD